MDKPYPLLCRPDLKEKIWGGNRLSQRFPQSGETQQTQIGEAWLVADLPEGHSTIANGPLSGQTLATALKLWGPDLCGELWSGESFPWLVKILDAAADLSVQVHPSDQHCQHLFPKSRGKDEFWIILESDSGSIHHGFHEGVTEAEFERCLTAECLEECLQEIEVNAGDILHIPPGTVHSLKKGVVLLEIQQPSDSTFRVYDYQRRTEHGELRPLHLEQARQVMNLASSPAQLVMPQAEIQSFGSWELLVDTPAFRIERAVLESELSWEVDPHSAQVLVLTQGEATLDYCTGQLPLRAWDAVVLPANAGRLSVHPKGEAIIVLTGSPGAPLITK